MEQILPLISGTIGALIGTYGGSYFLHWKQENKNKNMRSMAVKALDIFKEYYSNQDANHAYIYAPEPPASWKVFANTIYVLPESLEKYKQDSKWGFTKNILPMGEAHLPTGINNIDTDTTNGANAQNTTYYNSNGMRVKTPKGFTIIRYANGRTRKVMVK